MDLRDTKPVWGDQEVFDIPEAVGITASVDFLGVIRDKLIEQLNHLTIVSQLIPEQQREVSILKMYVDLYPKSEKCERWKTDLIKKQYELDGIVARKDVLIVSVVSLRQIMESILWELKD